MTDDAVVDAVEATFIENMGRLVHRHHVDESIHVLEFESSDRQVRTYATVGLAREVFRQEAEPIRQEIIFEHS